MTEIRPVESADVEQVVALVSEVLSEFDLRFGVGSETDAALKELPSSYVAPGGAFWVATDESGQVIGTCAMFPLTDRRFELRKMYLARSVRGSGLGARLLGVALEFARTRGARDVVLDTAEKMKRAIAFYESFGFVRDDAQISGARCSRGYRLEL